MREVVLLTKFAQERKGGNYSAYAFLPKKTCLHVFLSNKRLLVRHANIVQRVKSCYKIKIDSRVPDCCFYGVLLCKQHPNLTIAPLLHYNSATIRM